jgi:hypothetical protein
MQWLCIDEMDRWVCLLDNANKIKTFNEDAEV